ncbi:MAG TPA: DUF2550 domain-containing protein [Micromonosporaceae bacterium]|nr:DUF2550 domain-containing protein [Micromonosporaceae bacterium]
MGIVVGIGIGVLVLLGLVTWVFLRRTLIVRRGGTIELCLRLSTVLEGRGWAPGFARFEGDLLRWYRMFSLALGPRRELSRHGLVVESRRAPAGPERLVLPAGWVILRCRHDRTQVEIAMAESTVTGFMSWLEAAPPGAVWPRLAAR